MAKMKSGDVSSNRAADELRNIEVTLDFTPNADASVLYQQGDTMVLACATVIAVTTLGTFSLIYLFSTFRVFTYHSLYFFCFSTRW